MGAGAKGNQKARAKAKAKVSDYRTGNPLPLAAHLFLFNAGMLCVSLATHIFVNIEVFQSLEWFRWHPVSSPHHTLCEVSRADWNLCHQSCCIVWLTRFMFSCHVVKCYMAASTNYVGF